MMERFAILDSPSIKAHTFSVFDGSMELISTIMVLEGLLFVAGLVGVLCTTGWATGWATGTSTVAAATGIGGAGRRGGGFAIAFTWT
jgi:hypothetical protein